jgi:hypothetical protein
VSLRNALAEIQKWEDENEELQCDYDLLLNELRLTQARAEMMENKYLLAEAKLQATKEELLDTKGLLQFTEEIYKIASDALIARQRE